MEFYNCFKNSIQTTYLNTGIITVILVHNNVTSEVNSSIMTTLA